MKENNILKLILLAISKHTRATLFRNNTGTGWVGKTKRAQGGGIYIESPRPLAAGLCLGSSDLIGYTEKEITPDMVGKKIAIFTAVEIKKDQWAKTSAEQIRFIENVQKAGGIAGLAKSPEEAVRLINFYRYGES